MGREISEAGKGRGVWRNDMSVELEREVQEGEGGG